MEQANEEVSTISLILVGLIILLLGIASLFMENDIAETDPIFWKKIHEKKPTNKVAL